MPNLLCIETATEVCSVAIFEDAKCISLKEIATGNQHASQLAILIQEATKEANLTLKQLDAVVVSKGPGSYTGLRVGVSTAKGICFALNKPLIAINTLTSMAFAYIEQAKPKYGLVCPMIDARRMEVYMALYSTDGTEVMATEAKIIDQDSFKEQFNSTITFIGNGAEKCKGLLTSPQAIFETGFYCSAVGLGTLGLRAFNDGHFEDVAYFEPYYLKDFVGTTAKKLL
jgi:tRNA threonylcarbamoyladenosine biosynthesis protein TsaB